MTTAASAYWKANAGTTATSIGTCAPAHPAYGWMNDPRLTYDPAAGRLDFDVSWTPSVELVGYKIKTEWRAITATGATGAWQYGMVMPAWSTDCRHGPAHGYLWVPPAYGYELRWLRQDGSVVDYSTVYGTAKTTHEFNAPAPPGSFRAIDANVDSVVLAWTDAAGESAYRVERSQDKFVTIDGSWNIPANTTLLVDDTSEPAREYWYRIQASNTGGSSGYVGHVEVVTPNLFIPDVPEIDDAIDANCGGNTSTALSIEICVRQEMRTYSVYAATVRICETVNGQPTVCQPYVFLAPESPPRLPNEEDPSVAPSRNPDGSVWVPPSAPGEAEWIWEGDVPEFPTKRGRWLRTCPDGVVKEVLHWDVPHGAGADDHWGYYDCNRKTWERFLDTAKYGNSWIPKPSS